MAFSGEYGCPAVSRELLSVGSGGGIHDTLLLQSNNAKKKASGQQIVRLPVSNLVEKVQNFLPQIAKANEKLRKDMEGSCVQDFDIEHVDASTENIIEMNVALVELSESDTEEEFSSEDSSECEDSPVSEEVTVHNMKLPKPKREGRVIVLGSKTNE